MTKICAEVGIDAVREVVESLIFGFAIAVIYAFLFILRRKRWFPTGIFAYVMFEAIVSFGISRLFWRMLHFGYVGKLGIEEHIYFAIGSATVLVVLLKKISHAFRDAVFGARCEDRTDDGPFTEDG